MHSFENFYFTVLYPDPWKGFWAVPGGHVEDEGTYEAAVREAKEEIGDAEEVNWFSLNELKSLKLSPVTIQIINRLLYGVNQ